MFPTNGLINLGSIYLNSENNKSQSYCTSIIMFDYHGIQNALCGKTCDNNPINPKRLLIIQMI